MKEACLSSLQFWDPSVNQTTCIKATHINLGKKVDSANIFCAKCHGKGKSTLDKLSYIFVGLGVKNLFMIL